MPSPWNARCLLALALVGGSTTGRPQESPAEAVAPDGRRGFGAGLSRRDVGALFRSPEPADAAFLRELHELLVDVGLLRALAESRYSERGYRALLHGAERADPPPGQLFVRWRERAADPFGAALEPDAATAFARMFFDARFRARERALEGVDVDVHELRGALVLLAATVHGLADLTPGEEIDRVCERADLAAARLRAVRLDLQALYEPPGLPGVDARPVEALAEALVDGDRGTWGALGEERTRADHRVERDLDVLFTTRFDRAERGLLERRARSLGRARNARRELEGRLPPESLSGGHGVEPDVLRQAAASAFEGLVYDPFDAQLNYVAGLASDFFASRDLSRAYFDRFLVLRGIRFYDDPTYARRDLDVREEYALFVVASWRRPAEPPQDE